MEESKPSSNITPLNPNAKEFTPQLTLNPNAKEFLPKVASHTLPTTCKSSTVPTSIKMNQSPAEINMDMLVCSHQEQAAAQRSNRHSLDAAELSDALNENDSDLSQIVIEQLIQEANKEKEMEKSKCTENSSHENMTHFLTAPPDARVECSQFKLKSVTARKTTPWVNLRQKLGAINRLATTKAKSTSPLPLKADEINDIVLSEESDCERDDSETEDEFEDYVSPRPGVDRLNHIRRRKLSSRKQSASSSCDDFDIEYDNSRVRSLSVCSDESNFIEFGTPPSSEHVIVSSNTSSAASPSNDQANKKIHIKNIEKPKRCLLQTFVVHAKAFVQNIDDDTEDSDEGESDSDDDPDWDEVDGDDDVVDNPLWQSFKARVLVCPMSTQNSCKNSNADFDKFHEIESNSPAIGIVSIDSVFIQNLCDPKPKNEGVSNPTKKSAQEILEANNKWNSFYSKAEPENKSKVESQLSNRNNPTLNANIYADQRVTIAPTDTYITIFEDPEESAALRESRNGDYSCDNWARRKADKDRMEKLLSPVFRTEHRNKMWELIQDGSSISKNN